jgi:VWFA-related protein
MKRQAPLFALALALIFASAHAARTQQQRQSPPPQDEVLQVNTRVVFLDALVTDKKTKATASDLAAENFEVLADGQKRKVSYFSREGDAARRPLALVLIFDLERLGAGRHLRRTDILEAMAKELEKLPPGDEVAIVAQDAGGDGKREWLTSFTRNRGQLASALAIIPTLVGDGGGDGSLTVTTGSGGTHVSTSDENRPSAGPDLEMLKQQEMIEKAKKGELDEGDELDTVVNKKGEKLTRILKADGTLVITKKNKKGEEESEVFNDFDLPRASYEITKRIARERPNSQGAIVYVTDGIAPMGFVERDYVEDKFIRQNVIFSALVADMKTGFKLAKPLLAPLGNVAGIGIYGVAQHIAQSSGGDVVRVHSPNDYAKGLSQIIGNLNARYSLGFTLADAETDDGQMHALEVRIVAKDAKGKDRKLETKARRGYFMPATPKPQEAKKADASKAETQTKNQ